MAKKFYSEIFSSLLYILIGVILICFPAQALSWAMTVAGVLFVVFGILDVIKANFISGAVSAIIGIAILVLGWALTQIVLLVFGILIALKGVVALVDVLKMRRIEWLKTIFPIFSIVIGLMLAFGNGLEYILLVSGVLLVADGILGLVGFLLKK